MYICIYSHRHGDTILFHHKGGVDIGDVDAKVENHPQNLLKTREIGDT
jgi:succinyl-CoA synthetase beta subunit